MKNIAIRIVFALVAQALVCAASQADQSYPPQFDEQFRKQERIYEARDAESVEGYITDRSLASYALALPHDFDAALAILGPNDRWLDVGAGQGKAILDYFSAAYDKAHENGRGQRQSKASAVGLSIEDRKMPLWEQTAARLRSNQIQYLCKKRLRDYSVAELGRFQIITDVFGGFSYADTLSSFTEKALRHLELNGTLYTVLQDVMFENRANQPYYSGASFLTEIRNAAGRQESVCSWLKSISCVEVTCGQPERQFRPPIETYRVRKICDAIKVPALELMHYEAGTPPERGYRKLRE